jgi:sterol desaturase/sphingolipid hydroxylase (fatty acid hydroxylase superfamily)
MSSAERSIEQPELTLAERIGGWRYLGISSFLFAFLQAICPALVAIGAVRVFLGLGALALAAGTGAILRVWHADSIRIPMMVVAAFGAALNLFVIWQMRRLRGRPAAQWRIQPLSPGKLRSERWQIVLCILTFVCLAVEETMHWVIHRHHH